MDSAYQLHNFGNKVVVAAEPNSERMVSDYPFEVREIEGLSDTNLHILRAVDGLYKLYAEFSPDVLHVHGYFALLAAGIANEMSIPLIVSIHSTPVWNERIVGGMSGFGQELNFARKILNYTKPAAITAANGVYANAARKIVGNRPPVVNFPYPVNDAFFIQSDRNKYRNKFGLSDFDILILLPSRIIRRKGIKEGVKAFSRLANNFYLCLPCATSPLDIEYWQEIINDQEYQRVKERVIIPERDISHSDMPFLYAATDIVIMPSYYEGAPVATVETMASGIPFIGADAQGINSFIQDYNNGLLVPVRSTKELCEKIALLAGNRELQQRLTTQARLDVSNLAWSKQLPKLIGLYESAVPSMPDQEAREVINTMATGRNWGKRT